jgi:Nif-specific regulatory protein
MEVLLSHNWPGNIRELKAAVTYGATICCNSIILPEDLPMKAVQTPQAISELSPGKAVEKELLLKTLIKHHYNKREPPRI